MREGMVMGISNSPSWPRLHTFTVMAGRVPAIFARTDEARMAGIRPAMTDEPQPSNFLVISYPGACGDTSDHEGSGKECHP